MIGFMGIRGVPGEFPMQSVHLLKMPSAQRDVFLMGVLRIAGEIN
jgi:hypothetical protein